MIASCSGKQWGLDIDAASILVDDHIFLGVCPSLPIQDRKVIEGEVWRRQVIHFIAGRLTGSAPDALGIVVKHPEAVRMALKVSGRGSVCYLAKPTAAQACSG